MASCFRGLITPSPPLSLALSHLYSPLLFLLDLKKIGKRMEERLRRKKREEKDELKS